MAEYVSAPAAQKASDGQNPHMAGHYAAPFPTIILYVYTVESRRRRAWGGI